MLKKNTNIAGIDDATKCPCIGSIFIAGVVADPKTIAEWKKLGVKDSKLIAFKKREKLAVIIKQTATTFTVQDIPPHKIDNKILNLNDWEMLTVLNIIGTLQSNAPVTDMYIDNWEVTTKRFNQRYAQLINHPLQKATLNNVRLLPEHKADENHVIVGAASILAKSASDHQYRVYKEQYGDFGSGSPADPKTRLFVWNHRKNPLPIIRTSWQTFKTLSLLDTIEDDPLFARLKKKPNTLTAAE